jgi:hypothetical protein
MNDPSRISDVSIGFFYFIWDFIYLALVIKRKANAQVIIQIDGSNQFSVS